MNDVSDQDLSDQARSPHERSDMRDHKPGCRLHGPREARTMESHPGYVRCEH
jgi:hypothetical protein